eukprot:gene12139-6654_t
MPLAKADTLPVPRASPGGGKYVGPTFMQGHRMWHALGYVAAGLAPGVGSLGERMRVLSKTVHRVEVLLGEPVVPGGASGRAGGAKQQRQLGALGLPSGVEVTGLPRRPLFAGGAETEKVLRRLASAGGSAIAGAGWLERVRPDLRGVQRGDPDEWAAGEDGDASTAAAKVRSCRDLLAAAWRRCGCAGVCAVEAHRFMPAVVAVAAGLTAGQSVSATFQRAMAEAFPGATRAP